MYRVFCTWLVCAVYMAFPYRSHSYIVATAKACWYKRGRVQGRLAPRLQAWGGSVQRPALLAFSRNGLAFPVAHRGAATPGWDRNMRRTTRLIAAASLFALCLPTSVDSARAASSVRKAQAAPRAQAPQPARSGPPHSFLFGSWTGGLFPVPAGSMTAASCLATPTVIFTRDVVLRATVADPVYLQRQIETVRTSPRGAEFRFISQGGGPVASSLGIEAPGSAGFGCESSDVLHVERRSETEIVFTGCTDFPNPLVRCPSR